MSNGVAIQNNMSKIEQVLIGGDLSKLSEVERLTYYKNVCDSVGLNPLTKPFDYITLNGRLTLYARKDATDQLRQLHKISIKITAREKIDEVYVVTADASNKDGRTDSSTGAVNVAGLKGDNLANAMMKAETKSKRRVTLSICGLGLLDETELETIPDAKAFNPHAAKNNQPEVGDGVHIDLPACDCKTVLKFTQKKSGRYPDGCWYCPNFKDQTVKHIEPVQPEEYNKWKQEIVLYTLEQAAKEQEDN
jgi:hypothetical protein